MDSVDKAFIPTAIVDRFVISLGQDGRSKHFELSAIPDLEPEVDDMPALENYDVKDGRIRDLQSTLATTQTELQREKNRNTWFDRELASWLGECFRGLFWMCCVMLIVYYFTTSEYTDLVACRQRAATSERLILSIVDAIKPVFALRDDINAWGRGM